MGCLIKCDTWKLWRCMSFLHYSVDLLIEPENAFKNEVFSLVFQSEWNVSLASCVPVWEWEKAISLPEHKWSQWLWIRYSIPNVLLLKSRTEGASFPVKLCQTIILTFNEVWPSGQHRRRKLFGISCVEKKIASAVQAISLWCVYQ